MTKDDIDKLWHQAMSDSIKNGEDFTRYRFANLVAAAAREHAMHELARPVAQPEQEPVAWIFTLNNDLLWPAEVEAKNPIALNSYQPLYTTPPAAQPEQEPCIGKDPRCPCQDGDACHYKDCDGGTKARPVSPAQRQWQGLTEEDWVKIEDMPDAFDQGVAWAQARLKERNNGH